MQIDEIKSFKIMFLLFLGQFTLCTGLEKCIQCLTPARGKNAAAALLFLNILFPLVLRCPHLISPSPTKHRKVGKSYPPLPFLPKWRLRLFSLLKKLRPLLTFSLEGRKLLPERKSEREKRFQTLFYADEEKNVNMALSKNCNIQETKLLFFNIR